MSELLSTYQLTSYSWGALTLLLIVQILIADLIGIKSRHTPGSPVEADHQNLLFRATRTVANTFPVVERPMFLPNSGDLCNQGLVLFQAVSGNRVNKPIYIHGHSSGLY